MAVSGVPVTPLDKAGNVIGSNLFADIAMGKIAGAFVWNALGHNPDVDTGVSLPEDIWEGGGVYPWMTGATSLEIVSASALDTAAGTGARTFTVSALDVNFAPVTFTVTMNGLTPVAFPQQIYRLNRVVIASAGSGGTNAGDITIRNTGGGTTRAIVRAGFGITRSSAYTVPAGMSLYICTYTMSINRPTTVRDCTLAGLIKAPQGHFILTSEISVDGNPFERHHIPPIRIPATYDFIMRATYVSQDNTDITAGWSGFVRAD